MLQAASWTELLENTVTKALGAICSTLSAITTGTVWRKMALLSQSSRLMKPQLASPRLDSPVMLPMYLRAPSSVQGTLSI